MYSRVRDLHRAFVELPTDRLKVLPELVGNDTAANSSLASGADVLIELEMKETVGSHVAFKVSQEVFPFLDAPLTLFRGMVEHDGESRDQVERSAFNHGKGLKGFDPMNDFLESQETGHLAEVGVGHIEANGEVSQFLGAVHEVAESASKIQDPPTLGFVQLKPEESLRVSDEGMFKARLILLGGVSLVLLAEFLQRFEVDLLEQSSPNRLSPAKTVKILARNAFELPPRLFEHPSPFL